MASRVFHEAANLQAIGINVYELGALNRVFPEVLHGRQVLTLILPHLNAIQLNSVTAARHQPIDEESGHYSQHGKADN
jgi:hypothetical protein